MKIKSKGALWGIIGGGAVLLLVIALVIVEACMSGRLHIVNNTSKNIENISIVFFDNEQGMNVDHLFDGAIKAGESINGKYGGYYDFTGMDCSCDMEVTFEGAETVWVYDGVFDNVFKGSFDFIFTEESGEIYLEMKAYEGLFKSTKSCGLDSQFILDLEDGTFEDVDGTWELYDDYIGEDDWTDEDWEAEELEGLEDWEDEEEDDGEF